MNEWIEWGGGECPVDKDDIVDVVFMDGSIFYASYANCFFWVRTVHKDDIVKYRIVRKKVDQGKHYRYEYKGIKLDTFRIASIYGMKSFAMMTVLKKCLCAGNRGHKDYKQDLLDIRNAVDRELEMIEEDNGNNTD